MIENVGTVTIAVTDQDEALRWFTEKLDFEKRVDISAPRYAVADSRPEKAEGNRLRSRLLVPTPRRKERAMRCYYRGLPCNLSDADGSWGEV